MDRTATTSEYPSDKCVHQWFEEQVEHTPDAVAVVFEGEELTYRQLNERANQLAHHLRTQGVGPEILVGLCLDRSLELVIGILGIMKAGGAYIPLDPNDPPQRLDTILADAHVQLVITQERLLHRLPDLRVRVVCLDNAELRDLPTANPTLNVDADNLAYVMFTSGSTGQPKGVMIRHTSIARLVFANSYATFGPNRVFLQLAPASFDASTFELWGALLHGAKLVIAPPGLPDFQQLETLLKRHRVTTLWLTAALFNQVIEQYPQALSDVEEVLTGGEALSVRHIVLAQHHLGSRVQLINGYGPTESTTFACCYRIPYPMSTDVESIPIGRPISNTQVYVLDKQGHPVSVGVPGELHLGGPGLARGYLNRPELTKEKFVPSPFATDQKARLYRTGDLCRWSEDGNLEFLGRLDDQVKLRGYRIELGEIEAALSRHPSVAKTVVVLREDRPGDKRLVAYCVPAGNTSLDASELTGHLRAQLPEYMVPSALVPMTALPLTPNGKVDRHALPVPDNIRLDSESQYVAPRNSLEEQLASIWSEVLGLKRVGIHDNFFDLGGHSLLAVQVVVRIRDACRTELPIRVLFDTPTIAALAEKVAAARKDDSTFVPLERINREKMEHIPLSFAQQRLWFLEQMEGELTAYNLPYAWRLRGPLNTEALRLALEAIINRHEPLRTTFRAYRGEPVQVVSECDRFELPVEDWREFEPGQQTLEIKKRCRIEAERPFDLASDLMLRATLLRQADDDHILLLTVHHIAADGWSLYVVLTRELEALYGAVCRNEEATLPGLPVQYADYSVWQRKQLEGKSLDRLLEYWRRQLDGMAALELPTDRPRPRQQSYRGSRHEFSLDAELISRLKSLAQGEGVTLHMTLLAAFVTLLSRYSSQDDVAVGTLTAGRSHADLEGLIGFFVNTLVLRTDLSGDPTFRELLRRVQKASLDAYDHQDLPFEKLVEELQLRRDVSRSPLVQVVFQLLSFADRGLALDGLQVAGLPPADERVRFDLEMYVWQPAAKNDPYRATVIYNTDLFEAETIRRLAEHFVTLLGGIVANADQRLSALPLLTPAERQQLLVEWNNTNVAFPVEKCVHQLFEEQVERTPDAVALVFEGEELTYRQLNERANQLAHHLRTQGVGPEILVGLCLDRSLELVIGILGIMKAGGAYVPIDADHPYQRLKFMMQDAAVRHLVSIKPMLDRLPPGEYSTTCLDSDNAIISSRDRTKPIVNVVADDLAYVIYTSGSTGVPKGVEVLHRNVTNLFLGIIPILGIDQSTRFLGIASPTFDISVAEMLMPLVVGAATILVRKETSQDMNVLAKVLSESKIHIFQATPSSLSVLLDFGWKGNTGLTIVSTGEALPRSLARKLLRACNRLHDFYGPTETTIWSTAEDIASEVKCGSIGRPIANTQAYVLDSHRRPAPIGVPGELYLGGAGLARGYLNRPELTKERFVANPFSSDPGSRLYRTGDRCRWCADGRLEYLGRLDHQVKLRGFRIELGEIETALNQYPSVAQSVVVLREDRPGDKRLVAYWVAAKDGSIEATDLPSHLRAQLPEYMIPSACIRLQTFPLTPSGKINRLGLPAPDNTRPDLQSQYVGPRNPVEEQLTSIWCEVLGVKRVGIHDNFFDLGGHSLLAIQVVAWVAGALEVTLPIRKFFENPTIAELSVVLKLMQPGTGSSMGRPLERIDRKKVKLLPLSFAQQRLWFLEQLEPGRPLYNTYTTVRLAGALNVAALKQCFEVIIERHETLRTTFQTCDCHPFQVIADTIEFNLPVVNLCDRADQERESEARTLAAEEANRPFDLCRDLLLRAKLLRLADQEHLLVLTLHHIAFDGWSFSVLWHELAALYEAFSTGRQSTLQELPLQYADYTVWQRTLLQGENLNHHLSYWKEQLAGAPSVLTLPTDFSRPIMQTYRGSQHEFQLDGFLSKGLQEFSRREGVTLFMTLLAAWQVLLMRYSNQEDVVVGVPVAGRNRPMLEGLIGFFVNTLALRTDLSGNPTFHELLQRVRKVTLGAFAHQDLPFERLVEELHPERSLSHSPLIQVLLVLHNTPEPNLELGSLSVSPQEIATTTAKYDLSLSLQEGKGGLRGSLAYNTDLYQAQTIERMAGHFVMLLKGIVASPSRPISELPLLTEPESRQLLVEWNNTVTEYTQNKCVHQLFEEQVVRTPDAIALVFESEELTYRELNERANRLAHYLRGLGVGSESLVGLYLERSPELIIGILGILKAGGAYVPLDVNYPSQRIQFMLQDAAIGLVITQKSLLNRLASISCKVTCLDTDAEIIDECDAANICHNAHADSLVYVMYTSGSTGLPKGVEMPQAALVNLIEWHRQDSSLSQPARTLQFASCNFDVSFQEILTTLSCGGTLILISEHTRRDPDALWRFIVEERVERLFMPYVALQQLAASATTSDAKLHDIISAGEALQLTPAIRRLVQMSGCRLHNHYGPTECHVVTSLLLSDDQSTWQGEAPIGRPIANTQTYVLDKHGQPVPIGVPGELFIGGIALARGYLNRPELTAQKFVSNQFSVHPDSRLYRTGDYCRWRHDGILEFLGRMDHQIKHRGYRIELGEIEAVLNEHPSIFQSVVELRDEQPGSQRLVAYCVFNGNNATNSSELTQHLRDRLPDYMIPSAFVQLQAFPLTSTGKIDRRALPASGNTRMDPSSQHDAPGNPLEEQLACIWCEVLSVPRIGIHDNFFDLGGHSLLAVQLLARIEKSIGQKLPLAVLFQHGTIRQLTRFFKEPSLAKEIATIIQLKPRPGVRPIFLMPGITGDVTFSRVLVEGLATGNSVLGIQLNVASEYLEQFKDFRATAGHVVSALRAYQPRGPYALAGFSYGGMLAYEAACMLTKAGEQVELLAVIDTGPGLRQHKPQWADRWKKLAGYFANLPYWLREECRQFSVGSMIQRIVRKCRRYFRFFSSAGQAGYKIDDIFDVSHLSSQNRESLQITLDAFYDYEPGYYSGTLTLLRANAQSLMGDFSDDLGWRKYTDRVDVRHVNGNHETILHPPHLNELTNQLVQLLAQLPER